MKLKMTLKLLRVFKEINMYKVVINRCYGGFSLSKEASEYLNERYNMNIDPKYGYISLDLDWELKRHDKRLIEAVETLGEEIASGDYAELEVVEINTPYYRIKEYDGMERVETPEDTHWEYIHEGE